VSKLAAFSHEWTDYPSALFKRNPNLEQGYAMRKGNKSDYLVALKKFPGDSWRKTDTLPDSETPYAMVVDAMAFLQRNHSLGCTNLAELEHAYEAKLLSTRAIGINCVHFVGDRYDVSPECSLKGEEGACL
jgi:hypothetical protein